MFDVAAFKTTGPLADTTIRQMNEMTDFIASDVLTAHVVPKTDFKWYQYDKANLRRIITKKSSKAEADKVEFSVFSRSGACILHKLAGEVDPNDERDADDAVNDLEATTLLQVTEGLMIDYEKEAYSLISTTANYPSANTSALTSSSNRWSDTGGDPVTDAKSARAAVRLTCGKIPMDLAIAWETLEALKVNSTLIDRIKFTGTELPDSLVMSLLGVKNLHIAKAMNNTATEGAADVLATIWSNVALFFFNNPSKAKKIMTYGRTFICQELYTYSYEDPKRGAAKRIKTVESGWEFVPLMIATTDSTHNTSPCGYLYTNVV